jgi:hypothetical protein
MAHRGPDVLSGGIRPLPKGAGCRVRDPSPPGRRRWGCQRVDHPPAARRLDGHAAELGELFAAPAAVAVHNAQVLAQALNLTMQLQTALSSRPVIDQAIGLLRGRTGGTAEETFERLRAISQRENAKLAAVAQRFVEEAVRRARARHREK